MEKERKRLRPYSEATCRSHHWRHYPRNNPGNTLSGWTQRNQVVLKSGRTKRIVVAKDYQIWIAVRPRGRVGHVAICIIASKMAGCGQLPGGVDEVYAHCLDGIV